MTSLARAVDVWRNEGTVSFWFKLAGELGYRRLLVLARSLDEPVPAIEPAGPVRIGALEDEELAAYFAFRPEANHALVHGWRQRGDLCFVARHERRIVASCWAATRQGWSTYLDCAIDLAPGDGYLFDAVTLAPYRRQGIAYHLCLHQLRHLQQAGYRRAVRATIPENTPAVHLHAKSGFRPIGVMGRIKIGPWRHCYRRSWGP